MGKKLYLHKAEVGTKRRYLLSSQKYGMVWSLKLVCSAAIKDERVGGVMLCRDGSCGTRLIANPDYYSQTNNSEQRR